MSVETMQTPRVSMQGGAYIGCGALRIVTRAQPANQLVIRRQVDRSEESVRGRFPIHLRSSVLRQCVHCQSRELAALVNLCLVRTLKRSYGMWLAVGASEQVIEVALTRPTAISSSRSVTTAVVVMTLTLPVRL